MFRSSAEAVTPAASKYLQQLCKHFAHKVTCEWTPEMGRVDFPFGDCRMTAEGDRLTIACESAEEEGLKRMQAVIDVHLEKFAWREELKLEWRGLAPQSV
ncbi:DUF2218 domain-containing protein [Pannonibacter carbonis]|uniref:DUF2218 domain-containing protein n=1 Tax=Pannonibacter carbonis TaxID=2067569 RepID=UPI000D106DDE|nr:DUF2218 domain-containing protein [Pannonibacter carbonis]